MEKSPDFIQVADMRPQFGWGRTLTYQLLKERRIRAKKLGNKTLIDVASVREFMASLPAYGEAA